MFSPRQLRIEIAYPLCRPTVVRTIQEMTKSHQHAYTISDQSMVVALSIRRTTSREFNTNAHFPLLIPVSSLSPSHSFSIAPSVPSPFVRSKRRDCHFTDITSPTFAWRASGVVQGSAIQCLCSVVLRPTFNPSFLCPHSFALFSSPSISHSVNFQFEKKYSQP